MGTIAKGQNIQDKPELTTSNDRGLLRQDRCLRELRRSVIIAIADLLDHFSLVLIKIITTFALCSLTLIRILLHRSKMCEYVALRQQVLQPTGAQSESR